MMPVASEDKQAPVESQEAKARAGFGFPLPFDPVRLLAGMIAKWPVIVICGAGGLAAGAAAGIAITKPSYTLTASLMKRRVPENLQTGNTGQAYRPADMNDATLLATVLSTEALEKAVARAYPDVPGEDSSPGSRKGPPKRVTASQINALVEAAQRQGTDLYYVTYHSPISPEDAVKFTTIWIDEVSEYTKRLQRSDAMSVRAILQKEVSEMEAQVSDINREILNFSNDKQFLGTNTQVTAALGELAQITRDLEAAKATVKAKSDQIETLTAELRRQSPIGAQLKIAREEVASLRATYTDQNPLVKAKLQGISYLEDKMKEAEAKGPESIEAYTGTDIGNQLFLDIVGLRNERTEAEGKAASYAGLKAKVEERVKELPGIVSRYEELQKQRDSIMSSLALLTNRLKETEIFASGSPGYWQPFEGPELRKVETGSKMKKPLLLGVAGGVAGTAGSCVLLLLLTSRSRRRSVLECCAETQGPLLAELTSGAPEDSLMDTLWVRHFISRLRDGETLLVWTALASDEDEVSFWTSLTAAARRDGIALPKIVDLTPDSVGGKLPPTVPWTQDPPAIGAAILRAGKMPGADGRQIFSRVDFWLALATGQRECLGRATRIRELFSTDLSECDGTVAFIERPKSKVRRIGDQVSHFLATKFSRFPEPAKS